MFENQIRDGKIFESHDFTAWFSSLKKQERVLFFNTLIKLAADDIIPGCFRSYDIRIDSSRFPSHVIFYLGLKMVRILREITACPEDRQVLIGIGRSSVRARPSSPRIHACYSAGLCTAGAGVFDLGVTSTPDVYFSAAYLKKNRLNAVVNITASHNPAKDNGIKHCIIDPYGYIRSISSGHMDIFRQSVLKDGKQRLETDAALVRDIAGRPEVIPMGGIFKKPVSCSRLHNAFIILTGILGMDAVREINKRYDNDFSRLLEIYAPCADEETVIPSLMSLYGLPWTDLIKQSGLSSDVRQPAFFKKDPLKDFVIIIDHGRGTSDRTGEIFRFFGAEVVELDIERGFNPLEEKNRTHLKEAVSGAAQRQPDREVVGIAYDEDGDRLAVMRRDMKPVDGDRLLVLLCSCMDLKAIGNKKPLVITEVKSRPETRIALRELGVEALITPTGFAYIKDAAINIDIALRKREEKYIDIYGRRLELDSITPVQMWAELSGHFGFSQDFSCLFDDAPLMALHFLLNLSAVKDLKPGEILTGLDNKLPRNPGSGELNIYLKTADPSIIPTREEKEAVVSLFAEKFSELESTGSIDRTDGIQVFFNGPDPVFNGWILIRRSNNEDKLIVVTSAPDEFRLEQIEKTFIRIASGISLPPITGLVLKDEDSQGEDRKPDPYIKEKYFTKK